MTIIGAAHIMFLLVDGLDIAAVLTIKETIGKTTTQHISNRQRAGPPHH